MPGGDVDALEEIVEAQIVEIIEKRLGRAVDDLDGGAERRDWGMWIGAKHVKSAIQLTEFYRKQQAFGDVDVVDGADDADGCAARIARVAAADARADGPDALLNKSMFENEERPYLALFSALLVRYPRTNPAGAQGSGGVVSVAKFAHDYGLFQGYGLKGRAARKPTQQADKPTVAECVEYPPDPRSRRREDGADRRGDAQGAEGRGAGREGGVQEALRCAHRRPLEDRSG